MRVASKASEGCAALGWPVVWCSSCPTSATTCTPASDAPLRLRLVRWLLRRLSGAFQIESLYRFNRKFQPDWQPRYLAVEAPEALPQVALAILHAEGLLSLPWRLRGPRHSGGAAR
jgi:hypothetical protein